MILSVTYDKTSGEITVSSDVKGITADVNDNATQDDSSELVFEVAIDTTEFESSEFELETPEE